MHEHRNNNGTANGGPTVQPEIVNEPATGQAFPMPRNHGVPAGCVVVRKEVVCALAGAGVGALLMWLIVRELRGNR